MKGPQTRVLAGAAMLLAAGLHTGGARAQGAMDAARAAFERGLAQQRDGNLAEACRSFRESMGLVRELGPLRQVARCEEEEGHLRASIALLEELRRRLPAGDAERRDVEAQRDLLRGRLARLVVTVDAPAAAGLVVRLDGETLPAPGASLELDPGPHAMVVEQPGRAPVSSVLELTPGESARTVVRPAPAAAAPPPGQALSPAATTSAPPARARPLRAAGWVASGLGLAGFVGVGITGGMLLADQDAFERCVASTGCDARTLEGREDTTVAINAVAWGLGIAGIGVGATLLIVDATTDGSGPSLTARLAPGHAALTGRF